jgi:hypothetical protein
VWDPHCVITFLDLYSAVLFAFIPNQHTDVIHVPDKRDIAHVVLINEDSERAAQLYI